MSDNIEPTAAPEPQTPLEAVASSVSQFTGANQVVFILSMIGAGIMALVGLVPQCPPLSPYCYDSEKVINFSVTAFGLAAGIVSWWIWSFGRMISARVSLAAEQAK